MIKYWILVASREHVLIGLKENIAQVCHGKAIPLKKIKKNDYIIYYSPKEIFMQNILCNKFTAIGKVQDDEIYQFEMSKDFIPWRRKIEYFKSKEVEIKPLIESLSFIKNKKSWGMYFRYGIIEIDKNSFDIIAKNMLKNDLINNLIF